jgi:hypothetical protein
VVLVSDLFIVRGADGDVRGKFQSDSQAVELPDDYPDDAIEFVDSVDELSSVAVNWDPRLVRR